MQSCQAFLLNFLKTCSKFAGVAVDARYLQGVYLASTCNPKPECQYTLILQTISYALSVCSSQYREDECNRCSDQGTYSSLFHLPTSLRYQIVATGS